MRYAKGHKDGTRQHIVEVAAKKFREEGVAAAGIAGLMAEAGLTNGAFYNHFESKEHLVQEAMAHALGKREAALREAGPGAGEGFIRSYLSPGHRDGPGQGCFTAALAAEIARHPAPTREAFQGAVRRTLGHIGAELPEELSAEERERRAAAIYGLMIGTLQLARAVTDRELSDNILAGGLESALELAGKG
ncbi:TetR/AcrR family transcriptional regulator [Roseococcus sp.]|uniref:TetR/AcrR family transcriptional regulator n=1 Tax=Roseococcus sp. TaxID=2109646 RepID=UPI003BAAEF5C